MIISGLQKLSLIDYPGKVACVVFTPGCNLRCRFCHNPEFVLPERLKMIRDNFRMEHEFFDFLDTRIGLLDGVSICGGEPTIHTDITNFCKKIRDRGFQVKLDTNGRYPEILQSLLDEKLVDFIAMDIKHTWQKYHLLTGIDEDMTPYKESVKIIMESAPDYEFRTTVISGYHTEIDIENIACSIGGANKYILQRFRSGELLDESFDGSSPSREFLKGAAERNKRYVNLSSVRE